jgi:hypothetical protein
MLLISPPRLIHYFNLASLPSSKVSKIGSAVIDPYEGKND